MNKCCYKPLYQDSCENDTTQDDKFCDIHKFVSCAEHTSFKDSDGKVFLIKCSRKAIVECNDYNGSWPCGQPLCSEHLLTHGH